MTLAMAKDIALLKKRIKALEEANCPKKEPTAPSWPACPVREDLKCIGDKCVGWISIGKSTFSLAKGGNSEIRGCCIITRLSYLLDNNDKEERLRFFDWLGGDPVEKEKPNGATPES